MGTIRFLTVILSLYLIQYEVLSRHAGQPRRMLDTNGALTTEDKDIILKFHNDKRQDLNDGKPLQLAPHPDTGEEVTIAPRPDPDDPLPILQWSVELEYISQARLATCEYGHKKEQTLELWHSVTDWSDDRWKGMSTVSFLRRSPLENMYFWPTSARRSSEFKAVGGPSLWWSEHKDYYWSKGTTDQKKKFKDQVGHFLTMVGQFTTHVGCATVDCRHVIDINVPKHVKEGPGIIMACHYYPPSSIIGLYPYNNDPKVHRIIPPPIVDIQKFDESTIQHMIISLQVKTKSGKLKSIEKDKSSKLKSRSSARMKLKLTGKTKAGLPLPELPSRKAISRKSGMPRPRKPKPVESIASRLQCGDDKDSRTFICQYPCKTKDKRPVDPIKFIEGRFSRLLEEKYNWHMEQIHNKRQLRFREPCRGKEMFTIKGTYSTMKGDIMTINPLYLEYGVLIGSCVLNMVLIGLCGVLCCVILFLMNKSFFLKEY